MSKAYTNGQKFDADALNNPADSYWFSQTVYFTAGGSFAKASYPGLRAVKVKCVGGGGGSGGCALTGAGAGATSGGGGGGNYAEKWLLVAALGSSETVSVGAGGLAGSAGANDGAKGGTSSFGTLCVATGGALSAGAAATSTITGTSGGLSDTAGCVGDLIIAGSDGSDGRHDAAGTRINDACGGPSALGYGGQRSESNTTASAAGLAGWPYGGGASGAHNQPSQSAVAGAAGGIGLVIVELYF